MATKKSKFEDEKDAVVGPTIDAPEVAPNHHGGHHDGAYRGEVPVPAGSNAVPEVLVVPDEE
jgi:hypothetical protein